jgi:2-iminobutanoate/2-iminopropanoate deaminase
MGDVRKVIHTQHAPAAIGPYSQAIMVNGTLFCSGQIALDPGSGVMTGLTAAEQTQQVMSNLQQVLHAAGLTLQDVVRCCIYLRDMEDFADVNTAYGNFFPEEPPARVTVAVFGLPKDALVEISCIAVKAE